MKSNVKVKVPAVVNYEGGKAKVGKPEEELLRAVSTCLLFENTYYKSGVGIAERIAELVPKVPFRLVGEIAKLAKGDLKLRHVPLYLAVQMLKHPEREAAVMEGVIQDVIRRPDEMGEILKLYWGAKKHPIAACLKRGLAKAFRKFDAYQLAKWNRDAEIKLRDVMFLTHPSPLTLEQAATWKKLVDGTLPPPDTWEVALSAGKDKKETWERLVREKKLPYMAMLMNLRNMEQVGVDRKLVSEALMAGAERSRALPFRFISAAKAAPNYAGVLGDAMVKPIKGKLPGTTILLVDVSGSMDGNLSAKGTLDRIDAAGALAVLVREVAEDCEVYTFSERLKAVPNYRGLALVDAIKRSQKHGGTYLFGALVALGTKLSRATRVIVITDEQAQDATEMNRGRGYIMNVAPYSPGIILEGNWKRVNGWSERLLDWVCFEEYGKLLVDFEGEEE